jgi:magnesium chelatase subunit ChlD-like protein
MLKRRNLSLAKGLLARWSAQIYRERGELMVIGFSGQSAQVLQSPGRARAFNERWIAPIGGGGASPIEAGIALAEKLIRGVRQTSPPKTVACWLLSDGRFRSFPSVAPSADSIGLVDFEDAEVRLGRMRRLALNWGGVYFRAVDLTR